MKKADLRQQAEAKLSKRKKSPATETDSLRLIHELEVHQIELEMQNEELVQARAEAEVLHHQYADLYDFAPVGYFTLTRDGTIRMSNLTGANLLGAERSKLVKRRFAVFVSVESRPAFSAFLEKIFTTGKNEACEITLLKEGNQSCWVHLDAVCSEDRLECRVVMKDITERKLAEMELKESERRLRETNLDLKRAEAEAHIGNWKWNLRTATVEWSDEMFRIFGIDQTSYTGRLGDVISKVIHPDDLHIVLPSNASAFASNQPQEYRIIRPTDGAVRHIWAKAGDSILDEQGNPVFLTGVAQDITERKKAESALLASQNLYRLLAENSSDVISMIDAEGKAVYISPAYTRQLGYEDNELLNIDTPAILQQIHPDDRARIGAEIKRGRELKLPTTIYEYRTKTKQGGYIWVEDILRRQFDENGNFVRTIVNSRDITQRKQAEEALAESEKKFRALFETMSDGIVYEDHDGKIISANPAAERLLGLSFEQMQGRTSVDPRWKAIHADGSPFPGETHSLHVAATTGKPASDEVMGIYNPKLNAYVWLSVNSTPEFLPGEKKPFRAFAVFRDITERRQAEEALQKSNDRYEKIVTTVPVMLYDYILRPDGTSDFLYVSPKMCREILELDSEAILADMDLFWNLTHPEDISRLHQEDVKANLEGKIFYSEFRMIMPSGRMKWVSLNSKPKSTSPGEPAVWSGFLQDITERKQAEIALHESEAKLQDVFNLMQEGMALNELVFDEQGEIMDYRILEVNPAYERISTLTREQVVGKKATEIYGMSSAYIKEFWGQNLHAVHNIITEYYVPQTNQWRMISTSAPVDNKFTTMFSDITERKQIEDTLMFLLQSGYQDEDFFHSLARHLTSSLSMDYVCIDRLAGDQLSAQTLAIYFDGKFDDNVSYTLKDTPCGDVVGKAVCVFPSQVRHLFPLDVVLQEMPAESYVGTTLWSSQGKPIGLIAVIGRTPLSPASQRMAESILKLVAVRAAGELERQQAEEEQRWLNEHFEKSQNVSHIGSWEYNVINGTYWGSGEAKKLYGFNVESDIFTLEEVTKCFIEPERVNQALVDAIESDKPIDIIFDIIPRNSTQKRTLQVIGNSVRDTNGNPIKVTGVTHDITERQQAVEEIRQLNTSLEQRVEERTRELRDAQEKLVRQGKLTVMGELAGSVGHELRNPLSVINSAVYYLKMVQPDATDELKQYLNMIGEEVWNAEKIIDNLLDFGRAISADLEIVPVSELVDQTLQKITLLESVKVTLDIPTGLPKVYVDPRQMMQVFNNLIVNACQAMTATSGAGGKLTISAALQDGMVRVDISDNGIGIPSENLHKIFDPLFTTKAKGIGLGLALSKKLIEANAGRIEVESEAGKGTTFTVCLPLATPKRSVSVLKSD